MRVLCPEPHAVVPHVVHQLSVSRVTADLDDWRGRLPRELQRVGDQVGEDLTQEHRVASLDGRQVAHLHLHALGGFPPGLPLLLQHLLDEPVHVDAGELHRLTRRT